MEFGLSDEMKALQNTVKTVMEKDCPIDYIKELELEERFPYEFFENITKLGWNSLPYPEEYGGIGLGAEGLVILGEEISWFSYEIATGFGITVFSGLHILRHGTDWLKQNFLRKALKNELRFSVGITEPDAGSDAMALTTSAVLDGDSWVINGQKTFSDHGGCKKYRHRTVCANGPGASQAQRGQHDPRAQRRTGCNRKPDKHPGQKNNARQ